MESFDDMVTRARRDREVAQTSTTQARSRAEDEAARVVAEVERIGRDAARHLTDGDAATIPVIEFAPALLGGAKVIEHARAWVLPSGALRVDGVFLHNLPATAAEATGADGTEEQVRKTRALRKARIGEKDRVILAPAVAALGRTSNGIVTFWNTQLNFLPINDGALSLSALEGHTQRPTLAGTPKFGPLIAGEVAALLDRAG